MSDSPNTPGGIFASLRRILDGGLAVVQNRVELFAVEMREEKCRLVEAIILAAATAALGMMALTLLTLGVVFLFWDNGREVVLISLGLLYVFGALLAWRNLQAKLKKSPVLADTLGEIKKDRACLGTEQP